MQRRTVRVLSGAQVLSGVGVATGVAAGSLLVAEVSGSEAWAGLAQTSGVVGAAVAAVPLARLSNREGRRAGLTVGQLAGATGAVLVVAGGIAALLPLILVGTFFVGWATAGSLQARYAATDLAEPEHVAGSLSLVVWATTVGAVAGPNLMAPAGALASSFGLPELTGAYLVSAVALLLAGGVVAAWLRPDPLLTARRAHGLDAAPPHVTVRHALGVVREFPAAVVGLLAIVSGHAVMVMVMVMTPVHMKHVEVTLSVIGLVISVHILGMYALSPVVGALTDRFGARGVVTTGLVLLLVAAALAGTAAGDDVPRLGLGLFLLGLGWSCTLVAGSAMLTEAVPEAERPGVQGAGDTLMNAGAAAAGALAGVIVALASFGVLNAAAALLTLPLVAGLVWSRPRPAPVGGGG